MKPRDEISLLTEQLSDLLLRMEDSEAAARSVGILHEINKLQKHAKNLKWIIEIEPYL